MSKIIRKNGLVKDVQLYKCYECGRQFLAGFRVTGEILWREWTLHKQTYAQLAEKYNCSIRTIQRKIDTYKIPSAPKPPRSIILLMDTTYWGRGVGIMLFKDALSGNNLLKYRVVYETNAKYIEGVNELIRRGYHIKAIVCDGRRGLIQSFDDIPVQMCQFHQVAIIRRYLTRKPKLQAGRELVDIVAMMKKTDKESFVGALSDWHDRWEKFISERTISSETGKSFYTHKNLRSAYRSLKRNTPWLFTWDDHIEMGIPNTTNAIDGHFADLKNKLRCHNGLSVERKMRFVDGFLEV
ncbi:MAG: transposase [Mucinivorans sp.]